MLDLNFTITADGSQAKAEMRAVEAEKQRLSSSVQNATGWWQKEEQAIDKATGTLATHRGEVSKVEQAAQKMEAQIASAAKTTAQLGSTSQATSSALSGLGGGVEGVATQLLAMTGAADVSVGALLGIAGAAGVALGAIVAFAGFLAQSTKYYEEHAGAAKGLRDELGRVQQTWEGLQFVVGGAVAEGANAPLVAVLKLGAQWAGEFGLKLAADIMLAKELADQFAGHAFGQFGNLASATDIGDIPDPSKVLGGKHPLGSNFSDPTFGGYTPLPAAEAQRQFDEQEAERKRGLAAAKRLREQEERLAKAIQNLVDNGVPYAWGWPGAIPGQKVNMGAAGFDYASVPGLSVHNGFGTIPGTEIKGGNSLLAGLLPQQSMFGQVFDSLAKSGDFLFKSLLGGRSSNLSGYVGGSLAGGLMQGGLGKSISGALSGMFGKTIGSAVGSFIPFGGELLGSLVGKMFGPTQYQQDARQANTDIASLWKQINGQYGGHADQALSIFGLGGNDLHGKNFQGAMGVDPLNAQFDELAKRQTEFNGNLGDTLSKVRELGGNIPEALRPYLKQLADAKVLTQDNINLIDKLSGSAVPSYEAMEEAAKRLGVSTDSLGQSFQDAKAKANWQSVIDDLDTLTRGGADMNALLGDAGLQGKFNDLVQQSIKFGTTIPSNMKPWIQSLIDSGKLLGDDHQAITDINKLHFGGDMQTTLDTLNQTLKDLVDVLNVKLPDAIQKTGRTWRDELGDLPTPGVGSGRGGGDGTGAAGDGSPNAAAARAGGTAIIQIDGRTMAEVVVPHIPGVVDRYGLGRR